MQNPTYKDYLRPFLDWPTNNILAVTDMHGLMIVSEDGQLFDTIEKPGAKPWIFVHVRCKEYRHPMIITDLEFWAQCGFETYSLYMNVVAPGMKTAETLMVVNNIPKQEIEFMTCRDRDIIQDAFKVYTHGGLPQLQISEVTSALHKANQLSLPNSYCSVR